MQATRLTLICHARTVAQKLARFPMDEPVEMDWQAERGTRGVHFKRSAQLMCGPELRTRQTAELFTAPTQVIAALGDYDIGRWRGQRIDDLQKTEPEALEHWLADPNAAPHGGESVTQLCARVADWLQALTLNPGHVIAITHPLVIRAALVQVMQCAPAAFNLIDVEPLSATELRFSGRWRLRLQGPGTDLEKITP